VLRSTDPRASKRLENVLEPLSPKEIQARVRAGSSAEEVAAETGWPLAKVERYAGPLLAERAYVAQLAQAVEVRRSGGAVTGVGVTLADTVARVLWDEGMIRASVTWDARRRDDGKWVVIASFTTARGPVQASWTYDNTYRNLHPIDEAARRLMGVGVEQVGEVRAPLPVAPVHDIDDPRPLTAPSEARPHLVSLPTSGELDSDPFFDREVADFNRGAADFERESELETRLDQEERLLEPERREYELRELEHQRREHELREHELREHQRREHELREREYELREQQTREQQAREQRVRLSATASAESRGVAHQPTVALTREEPPNSGGKSKPKAKSRRSSVPSWDEILFGATRGDEN
jgi:hypothetical protein